MSISAGTDPPSLGLSPGPRPNRPPASPEAAAGPRPRNTAARRAHLPRVRPPAGFAAGSCSLFRERLVSETVVSLISSPGLLARSRRGAGSREPLVALAGACRLRRLLRAHGAESPARVKSSRWRLYAASLHCTLTNPARVLA